MKSTIRSKGSYAADMIKAVSFDIGGTLVRFEAERSLRQTLVQAASAAPDLVKAAYTEHFIKRKGSLNHFCELIQCDSMEKIDELITQYYVSKPLGTLYDDVLHVVKEMKRAGIFLMTISNKSYRNPLSLAAYGLNMYFDAEIYSCDVGSAKPAINIFRHAQNLAKVKPYEIVHIGNSVRSDVLGAKAALWHTVFLQRDTVSQGQAIAPTAVPEADHVITGLEQLLPIIENRE